jgi:hypothetical protein
MRRTPCCKAKHDDAEYGLHGAQRENESFKHFESFEEVSA